MPIEITPELLKNISALSELGNSVEQAATILNMSVDDFGALLRDKPEARNRWERGNIEAANQLKTFLHRQAGAGSVQAAKLLLQMKGADKPEKNAPLSSAPTPTPAKNTGSNDWDSVAKVARMIGVTERALRERVNGDKWPKLETREVRGKSCVSARAAYDHFTTHGTRRPDGLRKPPDYDEQPVIDPRTFNPLVDPRIRAALGALDPMEMDSDEFARRMLYAQIDPVTKRLAIYWAECQQRMRTAELKAAAMMDLNEVRKLIRAHAELMKEESDAYSNAFAEEALRFEKSEFGFDAAAKKPDAMALWGCFWRERMNGLFEKLEACIKAQQQKIRELEFKAAEVSQ